MPCKFRASVFILALIPALWFPETLSLSRARPPEAGTLWKYQCIDTMKFSRDTAREWLGRADAERLIDTRLDEIKKTGANCVSIGTPYDEEFLPILRLWVGLARKHGLSVWFRGNWSGWEGWFGYSRIGREEHLRKTESFILKNRELFKNGDVFMSCPECENGGPGDPRFTEDVSGHRRFLIEEHDAMNRAFRKIEKEVEAGFFSMNGDVARLVMDEKTTAALGGAVTIDHYVRTPEKLISDLNEMARVSGGKIALGEFGAPIPDIHGMFSDERQAEWIEEALRALALSDRVLALNYWVDRGGSTQLWREDGTARPAVSVLKKFFIPQEISGIVKDELDRPVARASVSNEYAGTKTDAFGRFALPFVEGENKTLRAEASGFKSQEIPIGSDLSGLRITLISESDGLAFRAVRFFKRLFGNF